MLTSFGIRALAVRTVTAKKGAPGIDGDTLKTNGSKMSMIESLKKLTGYQASPVRRVFIPKTGSVKGWPLGIPTYKDRAVQSLWNFILDVCQEEKANARSFGFRKGTSAKQSIQYA